MPKLYETVIKMVDLCLDINPNKVSIQSKVIETDYESKNKMTLEDWIKKGNDKDKFLPEGVSLKLIDFKNFYEQRKKLMKVQLRIVIDMENSSFKEPSYEVLQ